MARVAIRVKQTTIAKHASAARKKTVAAPKVRKSLAPGTIAIMLVGPYAGKRVVVLKALESGFMAVTGPYCLNRVPLRRAHQKHLIATSEKVSVAAVQMEKFTDAYFKKPVAASKACDITEQTDKKAKSSRSDEMKADQKTVDSALLAEIKKVSMMEQYLKTRFTLTATFGLQPHELKF